MTKNSIAPELVTRVSRIPGLEYRYTKADGHMLIAHTPSGLADRVAIFGNGQRALEALHMAVQIAEGVLAHMGYEDRASGRIDMRVQVGVRWPLAEVEASGADPADFKSALREYGNNWLCYEREEAPRCHSCGSDEDVIPVTLKQSPTQLCGKCYDEHFDADGRHR